MRAVPAQARSQIGVGARAHGQLIAHRSFRRFWLCLLGAMIADELVRTTLFWHVFAATGSSRAVGLLMFCMTGPRGVSGLLAGSFPAALASASLFGMCSGPLTVWAQTVRMRVLAPLWRGRAFAILRMIM